MVKLNIYVKTFLVSMGIFLIGILIGMGVENYLTSDFASRTNYVEESVREIELEMLYFQDLNETYSCNFLSEIVRRTNNNLDELSGQLLKYSESNVLFGGTDIENLKTILYFYDKSGCGDCVIQGSILSILKDSFKEKVMIFPLDTKVGLTMIGILMDRFNVTSVPSLVIEEKTYSGIVVGEALKRISCDIIDENITTCS